MIITRQQIAFLDAMMVKNVLRIPLTLPLKKTMLLVFVLLSHGSMIKKKEAIAFWHAQAGKRRVEKNALKVRNVALLGEEETRVSGIGASNMGMEFVSLRTELLQTLCKIYNKYLYLFSVLG